MVSQPSEDYARTCSACSAYPKCPKRYAAHSQGAATSSGHPMHAFASQHLGHHRHGADDIVSGERYNLIMWNKNSTYRLTREFMGKYMQPPSTDRETPDLVCLSYTHVRPPA
eukprot:1448901-Pleurochrysis_carterae.AAC.1